MLKFYQLEITVKIALGQILPMLLEKIERFVNNLIRNNLILNLVVLGLPSGEVITKCILNFSV